MGSLNLPDSGSVYLDTNGFIYSVERIEPYHQLLSPLWNAASSGRFEIVCSEMVLLEALVKPFRVQDGLVIDLYRKLFRSREVRLIPATAHLWEQAAELRARLVGLKTPDALHAATALDCGSLAFITNDAKYSQVPNLPVELLSST